MATPDRLMIRLYEAEKRHQKMQRSIRERIAEGEDPDSFKDIEQTSKNLIDRLRKELHEQWNIPEEAYKQYIDKYWMDLEDNELTAERSEKCLVNLRWMQEHDPLKEDIPCLGTDCFDCPDFDEATEDQIIDFLHGQEI